MVGRYLYASSACTMRDVYDVMMYRDEGVQCAISVTKDQQAGKVDLVILML